MAYDVEFTDEFEHWWNSLTADEQDSVNYTVSLLSVYGIDLKRPHADTLRGSIYPNMRELRVRHTGRVIRILYAFDPRRVAILLLGGDKTGNKRWYDEMLPRADALYARHLKETGNN